MEACRELDCRAYVINRPMAITNLFKDCDDMFLGNEPSHRCRRRTAKRIHPPAVRCAVGEQQEVSMVAAIQKAQIGVAATLQVRNRMV